MDPRTTFARTAADLVDADPGITLVYAEISGQFFREVERRHPERVVNVGIREQLLVNVGAGMALTGMRPIVHTFGSFLVERAFEQVKLGFGHQDVGGVLVGSGGSFDIASGGRTHLSPGDVPLMTTLPFEVHVPGHADEVDSLLRYAVGSPGRHYVRVVSQQNTRARHVEPGRFEVVRRGLGATVLTVGPTLQPVLDALDDRDLTVLYASTVRPFDHETLRSVLTVPDVVLVEPYLSGTSTAEVTDALQDLPARVLSLGVGRRELRRYGSAEEHVTAHGLDAAGLRSSITRFLDDGTRLVG